MSKPKNSIRIAKDGEDLEIEITGDLTERPADAIFLIMEAATALIGSMAKPEVDPDEAAKAYGTIFAKHIAADIRKNREEAKKE